MTHTHTSVHRPGIRLYRYTCRTRVCCNIAQSCCTDTAQGSIHLYLHQEVGKEEVYLGDKYNDSQKIHSFKKKKASFLQCEGSHKIADKGKK